MRNRSISFVSVVLTMLAGAACGDSTPLPTSPRDVAAQSELIGDLSTGLGEVLVAPLHRSASLEAPISWSFTAGPEGASSSNAAAGLSISVPQGALVESVTITVTALPGTAVAYAFAPHGLTFLKKVQLTQSLDGTTAGAITSLMPSGAHFPGDEPEYVDGLAVVNELVSARINLLQNSVSFPITHFSGWIVASGRSSDGTEGTQ